MTERTISMEQTILSLFQDKKYKTLKDIFVTMQPADIATILDAMQEEALPVLFRLLPKELAAEAFVEMDEDSQELLIRGFSDSELREVISELYVDDAVDLVEEMPANVVQRILRNADPDTRKLINELLNYPEDSAGSIMTTEYVSLRPSMTVGEAIKSIRRTGVDKETIYNCYVISPSRKLIGHVSVKDLLLAEDDDVISEKMDTNVVFLSTLEDKEDVANKFKKYDFMAMPVVDEEERLVGIVTFDDIIDVMEDEATEDIEIMAAIMPTNRPYLKTGVFETYKSRIPWLLLLMISATLTGMIITRFESALSAYVILTAFIPMLMDTGGNCGSQASVTVIRGISLDEIEFSDLFRVQWKEIRVSVLCGLTLAVANFLKLLFFDRVGIAVAGVVCLTLLVTVAASKFVGCTLPMVAKKLGFDPAVMASPFITTIVDAISLFIYFRFATLILGL